MTDTPQKIVNDMANSVGLWLERGYFLDAGDMFAELEEAGHLGLTPAEWRQDIDVAEANRVFRSLSIKMRERWDRKFDQNRSILEFGGTLIFEEMVLVLGNRDSLQLLPRYMDDDPRDQLKETDALLREVGENNPESMWEAREGVEASLGFYLPDHWWWRMRMNVVVEGTEEI